MPQGFDATNPPFDRLTHDQIGRLRDALDIGYFSPGQKIVERGHPAEFLHVVIKGRVELRDGAGELQSVLGPLDSFDARALMHGAAGEDFIAAEETLCYLLPRAPVLELIAANPGFAAFFYAEVSRKLEAFAETRQVAGMESVLHARVADAQRGRAVFIDAARSIEDAGRLMQEQNANALFVRDGERIGVVTGMNLAKALILRHLTLDTPVGEAASYEVIAIAPDARISEALVQMTRHAKRRLAVHGADGYTGFLQDIDLLGLFAGNSQLIPNRISRARTLADLIPCARDIQAQVERLHRQGIRVETIADITSDLNRRLHARVFDLTCPDSIRPHACLVMMGSEGRGEQTVRTDQDNGVLFDGPVPEADLAAFREGFSAALETLGFPRCPGNVMVSNPLWSQPVDSFIRQIERWTRAADGEAAMNLAMFTDAVAVSGDPALVARARAALGAIMQREPVLLARFALAVEAFAEARTGFFGALMASVGIGGEDAIDIKRTGTFPIVHGIRALMLERGVFAESTAGRIKALVEAGALGADFGSELTGALRVFMEFRLRSQLAAARRGTIEGESVVRMDTLSTADRDMLRDALRVVRQLREYLRVHFRLDSF